MSFVENGKLYGVYSENNLLTQAKTWQSRLNNAKETHKLAQDPDFHIRQNYGDEAGNNWVEKSKRDIEHYQILLNKVENQIEIFKQLSGT